MAKVCEEYKRWIEEEVETPLKEKVKKTRKKCKKKKCKKWCACCNKWKCWIETAFYWVVRWIVTIIGRWVIYTICRIISALITLIITALNLLWMPIKWFWCMMWGKGDLKKLPLRKLEVEVVVIDYDEKTKNPVNAADIDTRISYADRILREEARISVSRKGKFKRRYSKSLYRIDGSNFSAKVSEYLKGVWDLIGRNSARYLTVFIVAKIEGLDGLHLPLYGSVFIGAISEDTTLCHELGHALLSVVNTYDLNEKGYLMHADPVIREYNWPANVPKITKGERCTMRRSRWLEWSWAPVG